METKQFPEKWMVKGSSRFKEFAEEQGFNLSNVSGDRGGYMYWLNEGSNKVACVSCNNSVLPNGYTEVTLEELIAHYEPKKDTFRVKVISAEPNYWYKVGEEHTITLGETENAYYVDLNRAIYKQNCEIITEHSHLKWMPLTIGGLEVHINEEFEGKLFGRIKHEDNKWSSNCWYLNGNDFYEYSERNLIPYNPRIVELEEKITSKRSELATLEEELNTLKGK